MVLMLYNNRNNGMDYSLEIGALYLSIILSGFGLLYCGVRDYVNSRNEKYHNRQEEKIEPKIEKKIEREDIIHEKKKGKRRISVESLI